MVQVPVFVKAPIKYHYPAQVPVLLDLTLHLTCWVVLRVLFENPQLIINYS
jgi:hypothetical protein